MKGAVLNMGNKEKSIRLNVMKLVGVVVFVIAVGIFAGVGGTERWSPAFAAALSEKDISGIYSVSLPAASSPGHKIELQLNKDGEARFIEDYLDGSPHRIRGGMEIRPGRA